jgi:hypothetical protein
MRADRKTSMLAVHNYLISKVGVEPGHSHGDVSVLETWMYRQKGKTEVWMDVGGTQAWARVRCLWWIARMGV